MLLKTKVPVGDWFQIRNRIPRLCIFALLSFGCLNTTAIWSMAWHAILLTKAETISSQVKLKNKLLETVRKSSPAQICLLNLLLFLFDLLLFFDIFFDVLFDLLKSIGEELRHGVSYSYSGRVSNLPCCSKYQRLEVEKKKCQEKINKRPNNALAKIQI